jgi:hypothetical protein
MASIRKRGNKWQAQVRRDGARPVSRSFHQRADAERWARRLRPPLSEETIRRSTKTEPNMSRVSSPSTRQK